MKMYINMKVILLLFLLGCGNGSRIPKQIIYDIRSLPEKIQAPKGDNVKFINLICDRISSLKDKEIRIESRKLAEDTAYSVNLEEKNLRLRYSQIVALADVLSDISYCCLKTGESEDVYWNCRLRFIRRLQEERTRFGYASSLGDSHSPRSVDEMGHAVYAEMIDGVYKFQVRLLEKDYNDMNWNSVSVDMKMKICKEIECLLGRSIRTKEEIWRNPHG